MRHSLLKIFLIFSLLSGSHAGYGSLVKIDSLLQKLNTVSDSEKVYLLSKISRYYLRSNLSKSLQYALDGVSLADSIGEKHLIAEAYNRLGTVHLFLNNYEKASFYIIQSLKIREKLHDSANIASSYTNLALIYLTNKDYDKAIYYNRKSIELKKKLGITKHLGVNYNNMMIMYWEQKDWAQALYWGYKTLDHNKAVNNILNIAETYGNIGGIYHEQKQYDRALKNYKKALYFFKLSRDTTKEVLVLNNLATLYLDKKNPDKALTYLLRSGTIVKRYPKPDILTNYYSNLSTYYKQKGDLPKAYQYLKIYAAYHDTLQKKNSYDKILDLQKKYDSQNMEYKIRSLKQDQEIKKLVLKREQRRIIEFLIFLILVIIFILLTILMFRRLKNLRNKIARRNKSLEEANIQLIETERQLQQLNQTKDKFFSIIAHDLINPFQPLLGLSELLITDMDKLSEEDIKRYATLIKESAMKLYNLLSNLLKWTQTQTGRLSYNPEEIYINELVTEILSFYTENAKVKNIHLMNHINKDLVVYADRELLSAIFRNLISNAIKFTNNHGYVKINAIEKDAYVEVSVEDNGIGIDPDRLDKLFMLESAISTRGTRNEEGTGLGLILCKEFVEKNGGKIRVSSRKGKGSIFYFTLPKAAKS